MSAKFSPSLMCMDLTQFKEQITAMNKKADFYHVDIMDGNYVRNITLSPFFIENLKKITTVPIDVHLSYVRSKALPVLKIILRSRMANLPVFPVPH